MNLSLPPLLLHRGGLAWCVGVDREVRVARLVNEGMDPSKGAGEAAGMGEFSQYVCVYLEEYLWWTQQVTR